MKSLQIAIAVISEGETEGWYLRQMRTSERINFDIFPKEGKNISGLQKKLIELLKDDLYDYIFCLIDMDTKENPTERQKFDELVNKFKMNKNVYFLKSQPCFEYWFFLHKSKYSGRFFKTWENIEPLKPEIKKIIPGYEKSKKFYYSHSGQG